MTLTAFILIVCGLATFGGLVYALARLASVRAANAARAEAEAQEERDANEALKRAGSVMAEHRDRQSTADRLHNGGF